MKWLLRLILIACVAAPSSVGFAQITPRPDRGESRIQTLVYRPNERFELTASPSSVLTIMFLRGEGIIQAETSNQEAFDISVTPSADSLNLFPKTAGATTTLSVKTVRHSYTFDISTSSSRSAAFLVRFIPERFEEEELEPYNEAVLPDEFRGTYKVSGDKALRPVAIGDDGDKTYIEWGDYQFLPAVFGIGPTGDEEVVDGHVRGDLFVIDRVYPELVFRIDKDRAKAKREQKLVGYER